METFVKVTKCSNTTYWYNEMVGSTLKVNYKIGSDFRCWHPTKNSSYLVLNCDCKIIN